MSTLNMSGTSNLSFFIKTSNIKKCENRRCHTEKVVLVYTIKL